MLNKVILIGNLGRDPASYVSPSGTTITKFSLATNRKYRKASGDVVEEVCWHNIVVFGKLADNCQEYLQKGARVLIEGRINNRTYQEEDKVHGPITRYWSEVVGERVQFLSPRGTPRQATDESQDQNELEQSEALADQSF